MKDLARENVRLRCLVADLSLEKKVLKALLRETCKPRTTPRPYSMRSATRRLFDTLGINCITVVAIASST